MEKQYKAITEGQANGTAILSYSIEIKPEGFLQTTSLKGQVVQPFSIHIHSSTFSNIIELLCTIKQRNSRIRTRILIHQMWVLLSGIKIF